MEEILFKLGDFLKTVGILAALVSLLVIGIIFTKALIQLIKDYKKELKTRLITLKERTYYPIGTIGIYRGTKVEIAIAKNEFEQDVCTGCMADCPTAICKAHNFMCDSLDREDEHNIIIKEIQ